MQQGGVIRRHSSDRIDTAFNQFFKDSDLEIFSTGSRGGILFELKYHGRESPYVLARSAYPFVSVNHLLLKIVILHDDNFEFEYTSTDTGGITIPLQLNMCTQQSFEDEVKIQSTIYEATLDDYLEPVCPSVVYSHVMRMKKFLNEIRVKSPAIYDYLSALQTHVMSTRMRALKIGILAMEKMNGFTPLVNLVPTLDLPQLSFYRYLAVYEFYRMYQATGMLHGDFHEGNIMVHPNYYYLHGMPRGRVIIIDFGASFLSPHRVSLNIRKTQDLIRQYMKYPSPTWGAGFVPSAWIHYQWIQSVLRESTTQDFVNVQFARELAMSEFQQHVAGSQAGGYALSAAARKRRTYLLPHNTPKSPHFNHFDEIDPEGLLNNKSIQDYIAQSKAYNHRVIHRVVAAAVSHKTQKSSGVTNKKTQRRRRQSTFDAAPTESSWNPNMSILV